MYWRWTFRFGHLVHVRCAERKLLDELRWHPWSTHSSPSESGLSDYFWACASNRLLFLRAELIRITLAQPIRPRSHCCCHACWISCRCYRRNSVGRQTWKEEDYHLGWLNLGYRFYPPMRVGRKHFPLHFILLLLIRLPISRIEECLLSDVSSQDYPLDSQVPSFLSTNLRLQRLLFVDAWFLFNNGLSLGVSSCNTSFSSAALTSTASPLSEFLGVSKWFPLLFSVLEWFSSRRVPVGFLITDSECITSF